MKELLNLKSWQIFGLIIIVPFLLIIAGVLFSKFTDIEGILLFSAIVAPILMIGTYYGWIYQVGVGLNSLQSGNKQKLTLFKVLFFLTLFIYIVVNPVLKAANSDGNLILTRITGFVGLAFLLYCIYFVANSLQNVEKERNIPGESILVDFVLIWFLPIGIWFLQARIQRIFSYDPSDNEQDVTMNL